MLHRAGMRKRNEPDGILISEMRTHLFAELLEFFLLLLEQLSIRFYCLSVLFFHFCQVLHELAKLAMPQGQQGRLHKVEHETNFLPHDSLASELEKPAPWLLPAAAVARRVVSLWHFVA